MDVNVKVKKWKTVLCYETDDSFKSSASKYISFIVCACAHTNTSPYAAIILSISLDFILAHNKYLLINTDTLHISYIHRIIFFFFICENYFHDSVYC